MAALTDQDRESLLDELNRYPGVSAELDKTDRRLYTQAIRFCKDTTDMWRVISEIRTQNGNGRGRRPSVKEVEDLAKDVLGIDTQPKHIKPLPDLVKGWEQDAEQNREEPAPDGTTARDRARAAMRALAERTPDVDGKRTYSYGPEEFRPAHPGDADPMTGIPLDDRGDLIAKASAMLREMVRSPHPRRVRELAAKLHHDRQGALHQMKGERAKFGSVLGGMPK
jgi:hypothetical protein